MHIILKLSGLPDLLRTVLAPFSPIRRIVLELHFDVFPNMLPMSANETTIFKSQTCLHEITQGNSNYNDKFKFMAFILL